MAANISDTDVIIDTRGVVVPECAHGMQFSNLFPCTHILVLNILFKKWPGIVYINFSMKVYSLLLKLCSYSNLQNRGLTCISYTIY